LKTLNSQRDIAFQLALRLTMRRILATLAVVGALLFSAGSAWADFDDGVAAYERGDYATALREFRPLAEQGHAQAQSNLGVMYAKGEGIPEDYVKAHMWWSLAKTQGNKNAPGGLDAIKPTMTSAQIAKAQALASEWWEKHNN
jgi:TPR repeat protein